MRVEVQSEKLLNTSDRARSITKQKMKDACNYIDIQEKIIKPSYQRFLNKSRKLKDHHIDFIRVCTAEAASPLLSLTTLKNKIKRQFADINDISLPTIVKMLKRDLKMSYKKLSKIQAKAAPTESINWMIKSACLLKRLSEDL